MLHCQHCSKEFRDCRSLKRHLKSAKYCIRRRKIMFSCVSCKYIGKNLRDIELHVDNCHTMDNINPQTTTDTLQELQHKLQIATLKNKIYEQIIKQKTDINFEHVVENKPDGIHVYNYNDGKIPVIVHDFINDSPSSVKMVENKVNDIKKEHLEKKEKSQKKIVKSRSKKKTPRKTPSSDKRSAYRSIPGMRNAEVSEDVIQERLSIMTKETEEKVGKIFYDHFEVSRKDVGEEIDKIFTNLSTATNLSRGLRSLKKGRSKLLGVLDIEEYSKLILEHEEKLRLIFRKKRYDEKTIKKNLKKSMSTIDMRLISYDQHHTLSLDSYDREKFERYLEYESLVNFPKQFTPFNFKHTINKMLNYGLVINTIREILTRCVVNKYGYWNIVYLDLPKSTKENPYSYYKLEYDDGGVRKWKMDCRLEHFSTELMATLKPYCVSLFKQMYKEAFGDNDYREKFEKNTAIGEELEQLLRNIILLSQFFVFCDLVMEIVMINSTIKCSQNDKFCLYSDDNLQRKRFSKAEDNNEDIKMSLKGVFDNIKDDDIDNLVTHYLYSQKV